MDWAGYWVDSKLIQRFQNIFYLEQPQECFAANQKKKKMFLHTLSIFHTVQTPHD